MHQVAFLELPAAQTALTACAEELAAALAANPALTVTCAADAARIRRLETAAPAAFGALQAAAQAGRLSVIYAVPALTEPADFTARAAEDLAQIRAAFAQDCDAAWLPAGALHPRLPQLLTGCGLRLCMLEADAAFTPPAPLFWLDGVGEARLLAACGHPDILPPAAVTGPTLAAADWFRAQCLLPLDLPTLQLPAPAQPPRSLPLPAGLSISGDGIALLACDPADDGCRLLLAETAGRTVAAAVVSEAPAFGFYADFAPYALKSFLVDAAGCVTEPALTAGLRRAAEA